MWLICYLVRTSINFAHFAGFSAIIIRGPNHSEIDHHLCRQDERIRFFFRSEAAIVSGEAAIVILPREKKNPLDAAVTNLTSMRF